MASFSKQSKDEKMKTSYDLFERINWDLSLFHNYTGASVEELKQCAREYIETVLIVPLTKEQIWFLMPTDVRLIINNHDSILKEMLRNGIIIKNNLKDLDWMKDNLRIELCKFCYDTSENLKWITDRIREYCNERDIQFSTFRRLSNQYVNEVLKLNQDEKEEHRSKKEEYWRDYKFDKFQDNPKGKYAKFFMSLLQTDDKEEIFKLVRDINKEHYYLRSEASDFVVVYYKNNAKVKEEILNKLKIYFDVINEHRKNERDNNRLEKKENNLSEKLKLAEDMVKKYVEGEFSSPQDFCDQTNFNKNHFDLYIRLLKEHNKEIYDFYIRAKENQKQKDNNNLASKALYVIDLIKNGVTENGVKREFDLVDFYKYLPGDFVKTLRAVRDSLDNKDYMVLIDFTSKHKWDKELSQNEIENIYNTKTVISPKMDSEGNIIPGTGREITIEDKQNIVKYLNDNNIPVTNKTYNIIYKRWLAGSLTLEEEKDKTK